MKKLLAILLLCTSCASLKKAISETEWPWDTPSTEAPSSTLPPVALPLPTPDPLLVSGVLVPSLTACNTLTNRIGFDIIGLLSSHMDAKGIADQLPPNVPVGWLDGTFGKDTANAKTLLDSGRVSLAIVTILNTVGPRNKQAVDSDGPLSGMNSDQVRGKLEAGDGTFKAYVQHRVDIYKELASHYPCTKFVVKPALEHDLSEKAYRNLEKWVSETWPGVQQVNNPLSGWKGSGVGAWLEQHGENTAGAAASSLDGKSLYKIDRAAWRNRTEKQKYTLSWIPACNCRPGEWTPPITRTQCLTAATFRELLAQTYN